MELYHYLYLARADLCVARAEHKTGLCGFVDVIRMCVYTCTRMSVVLHLAEGFIYIGGVLLGV